MTDYIKALKGATSQVHTSQINSCLLPWVSGIITRDDSEFATANFPTTHEGRLRFWYGKLLEDLSILEEYMKPYKTSIHVAHLLSSGTGRSLGHLEDDSFEKRVHQFLRRKFIYAADAVFYYLLDADLSAADPFPCVPSKTNIRVNKVTSEMRVHHIYPDLARFEIIVWDLPAAARLGKAADQKPATNEEPVKDEEQNLVRKRAVSADSGDDMVETPRKKNRQS